MKRRDLLHAFLVAPVAWPSRGTATGRPPQRDLLLLRTRLAGFGYHSGPELRALLRAGQSLTLVREPANPHDANAIRIDWRGQSIGYLPRHHNHAPARLLDEGATLRAEIAALDFDDHPWWPVEVDLFLAVPDGTFTAARG